MCGAKYTARGLGWGLWSRPEGRAPSITILSEFLTFQKFLAASVQCFKNYSFSISGNTVKKYRLVLRNIVVVTNCLIRTKYMVRILLLILKERKLLNVTQCCKMCKFVSTYADFEKFLYTIEKFAWISIFVWNCADFQSKIIVLVNSAQIFIFILILNT